ncbi:MAG TPA: hypothetical protein VM784_03680 [Actinomycetota bacterium]|nr:hypothetical protein [Actinomycetota bacterium]
MAYVGNLTCRDCGLTFTSRWGPVDGLDEYRCGADHVVLVERISDVVVAVDGAAWPGGTLVEQRGCCPLCGRELATGRLPLCPVCGGGDHDVVEAGILEA